MKILLAGDDADLRTLIAFTLTQAGYEGCVSVDGVNALRTFEAEAPDLVLLDVRAPVADGLDLCREIRRRSRVPVMMLSAREREEDMVAAFDAGADDYLRKPFSPRVLLARIKALLRRAQFYAPKAVTAGRIRLEPEEGTLHVGEAGPVHLTPLELNALHLLINTPGRTVTAERLLMQLWGRSSSREHHTLKQLIYRLRRKIEIDPSAPQLIVTTPNAGYKLVID